jgi:lipid-A-disaccharide synthase-like uncharacterized protein
MLQGLIVKTTLLITSPVNIPKVIFVLSFNVILSNFYKTLSCENRFFFSTSRRAVVFWISCKSKNTSIFQVNPWTSTANAAILPVSHVIRCTTRHDNISQITVRAGKHYADIPGISGVPKGVAGSSPPPGIPKFCQSWAEFPVPWNIHP